MKWRFGSLKAESFKNFGLGLLLGCVQVMFLFHPTLTSIPNSIITQHVNKMAVFKLES